MIVGFRNPETELLWRTGKSRRFPANLRKACFRKLAILNAALALENLTVPPGNRLEKLSVDRADRYLIRINDQHRICFCWSDGNAFDVEIVDYH